MRKFNSAHRRHRSLQLSQFLGSDIKSVLGNTQSVYPLSQSEKFVEQTK